MRNFLTCAVLIVFRGVTGGKKTTDRDKLISMLAEIGAHDSTSNQIAHGVGTFLEESRGSGFNFGFGRGRSEPPRRRGGHAPCECPDSPGDSYSTECLNRRVGLVVNQFQSIQAPNTTTNVSIAGGMTEFRNEYINNLIPMASSRITEMQDLWNALLNPSIGYLYQTDRTSQKLLNEETLMLFSLNQAWMSAVNVSDTVAAGASQLQSLIESVERDMLNWFNGMQQKEESVNYKNIQQTTALANNALKTYTASINQAQSAVFSLLSGLEKSISKSSSSAGSLGDALESAAYDLQGQIQSFNQSLSDMASPTAQSIQQGVTSLINQYQSVAARQVTNLQTTAATKISQMRNATTIQIENQDAAEAAVLANARSASVAQIGALAANQATLVMNMQSAFHNISSYIDAQGQNKTSSLNAQVSAYSSNISAVSDSVSLVQNQVTSFNNTEKTTVSSTQADVQSYDASAQKMLTSLSTQATAKQSQTLNSGQAIASGSIQAVGTNFQQNMNEMGINTNALIGALTSSASAAAQQSAAAASGLSAVATTGQQTVGTAKDTVTGSMQSAYGSVLTNVGNIPSVIEATTTIGTSLVQTLSAANANNSNTIAQVQTAASTGVASSAGNLTNVENTLGSWVSSMNQDEPAAQALIDNVGRTTGAASSAGIGARANSNQILSHNSNSLADAANQIANSEDAAGASLSATVNQFIKGSDGSNNAAIPISGSLSSTLSSSGNFLATAQTSIDSLLGAVADSSQTGLDALTEAQQKTASVSRNAEASFQSASNQVSQSTAGALSDLNGYLASASDGASGLVSQQLSQVDALKNAAAAQVSKISGSQAGQIESLASSIDSLMQKTNAYLNENSGPLAAQLQGLTVHANRLLLQLNALEDQAGQIEGEASSAGGYAWSDLVSAFSKIFLAKNSSANDLLTQVGSRFNQTAGAVNARVLAQVQALVTNYSNEANLLQSQLGSVSSAAASQLSSESTAAESSNSMVGLIQSVTSSVSNAASSSSDALYQLRNKSAIGLPSNISALYGLVSSAAKSAGADSQYASSILDKLAAQAQTQVSAIQQFNQTNGSLSPSDVQQQHSMASMSENVARAKLEQQQAFLKTLSGASTDLSSDYEAQVQAAKAASSQNAALVYNQVLQSKAQVSQMVGKIAASFASQHAEMGSSVSEDQSKQLTSLATMRLSLTGLLSALRVYTSASNSSFSANDADMSSVASTLLGGLKSRLGDLDHKLILHEGEIKSNISQVQSGFDLVNVSTVDGDSERISQNFNDWVSSQVSKVRAANSTAKIAGVSFPLNESVAYAKSNATLYSVAVAAQSLLAHFDKNVPQIDQIIAKTAPYAAS